jgi:ubiquinone/menaquinone biosynthesis C-methylase UbiE
MNIFESRMQAAAMSGGISSSAIYRAAIAAATKAKANARNILDYGSGKGDLIPWIAAQYVGATITGADITERPSGIPDAVGWASGDLNQKLPVPDESVDLIFAIEVIEHLENPRHVMRELMRMLRPGGAAVVTTPNSRNLRSMLMFAARGHFAYFGDDAYPAHITVVTPLDLKRAAMEAGFRHCEYFFTNRGVIPKFLHWRWQQIPLVGGLFRGSLFSENYGAVLLK